MTTSRRSKAFFLAGYLAFFCIPLAQADAASNAGLKAELQSFFDQAAQVINNTNSAQALADMLYADDLTVIGDGEQHLYPNLKSFVGPLQGYFGNCACRLTVVGEPRQSGNLAATWVLEHCDKYRNYPPEDYRVLWVLRKGPKGWRVTMEMFGVGTF